MLDADSERLLAAVIDRGSTFTQSLGIEIVGDQEKYLSVVFFLRQEHFITPCATSEPSYKICPKAYAYFEAKQREVKRRVRDLMWGLLLAVLGGIVSGVVLHFLGMG